MLFRVLILRIVTLFFMIVSNVAFAASPDEVRALIYSGDYETARLMAESFKTAEGYALAAESLSAQILLGEVDKLNKRSKKARKLATLALELKPELYEAKLQYALADGFVTRTSSKLTAWRKKLPTKTFATIKDLRTAYPGSARGIALEGAWHLGVIRKAGARNGQKWFGANAVEGERLYDMALKIAPQDIVISTNYALSFLVLNQQTYREKMRPVLESIATMPAGSHLEREIQQRVNEILKAYANTELVQKMAEQYLDGE